MERLLACAAPRYRLALATGLFSGVRLSKLLGLRWDDVDFAGEVLHVRAQMDRSGQRQPFKTAAARRDVIAAVAPASAPSGASSPAASSASSAWASSTPAEFGPAVRSSNDDSCARSGGS